MTRVQVVDDEPELLDQRVEVSELFELLQFDLLSYMLPISAL